MSDCYSYPHLKQERWLYGIGMRTTVAVVCSLLQVCFFKSPLGFQAILATCVQLFCAYPLYDKTYNDLKHFVFTPSLLFITATICMYLMGFYAIFSQQTYTLFFQTSSCLVAFYLLGTVALKKLQTKAQQEGEDFKELWVRVQKGVETVLTPFGQIRVGDMLLIAPFEMIPFDAVVKEGSSAVDESLLTGQSLMIEKKIDSFVFAGSKNQYGNLTVEVAKEKEQSALNQISVFIEKAKSEKLPSQLSMEKAVSFFIPGVFCLALMTWAVFTFVYKSGTMGVMHAVSILLLANLKLFTLATPLLVSSIYKAAALQGIFIKSSKVLEIAAKIKKVFIDKAVVVQEQTVELTKISLEKSYFPIVKTLCQQTKGTFFQEILHFLRKEKIVSLDMLAFRSLDNKGVSGYFDQRNYFLGELAFLKRQQIAIPKEIEQEIGQVIGLATGKLFLGYFVLHEKVKEECQRAVRLLREKGIETILLAEGSLAQAEVMANLLGADSFQGEMGKEETGWLIEQAKNKSNKVAFVADGQTEALALAIADVGFAVSKEGNIAMEGAMVGLMQGKLTGILKTIDLSKTICRHLKENTLFAFGYHLIVFPLAMLGYIPPLYAMGIMGGCSIAVILNTIRLKTKF